MSTDLPYLWRTIRMTTELSTTLLSFLLCAGTAAQAAAAEESAMNDSEHKAPQIPPQVARYLFDDELLRWIQRNQ